MQTHSPRIKAHNREKRLKQLREWARHIPAYTFAPQKASTHISEAQNNKPAIDGDRNLLGADHSTQVCNKNSTKGATDLGHYQRKEYYSDGGVGKENTYPARAT